MASEVQIYNLALVRVGCSQLVAETTEHSNEARVCRNLYRQTRDRILETFPWPFATRREALQDLGDPPLGWKFRYRYPGDCLFARKILDKHGRHTIRSIDRIPYSIMEDEAAGGLVIVSNHPEATLEFTACITNPQLYSAAFVDCVGWALAAEIATPLSADPKYGQVASQMLGQSLGNAAARALNEEQAEPLDLQPCDLLDVRY